MKSLISLVLLSTFSIFAQDFIETNHHVKCSSADQQTQVDITVTVHKSSFIKFVKITDQDVSVESEYKTERGFLRMLSPKGYNGGFLGERYINLERAYLMFEFTDDQRDQVAVFESYPSTFDKKTKTFQARFEAYSPKTLEYMNNLGDLDCKFLTVIYQFKN